MEGASKYIYILYIYCMDLYGHHVASSKMLIAALHELQYLLKDELSRILLQFTCLTKREDRKQHRFLHGRPATEASL